MTAPTHCGTVRHRTVSEILFILTQTMESTKLAGSYNATAIDMLQAQNDANETNKMLFYAILKELKKQTSISQGLVA